MGNILGIAIVWFIIEMLLWYLISQFVSGWWVFGWFILAFFIGSGLIKKGTGILKPLASQAQANMFNPAMRSQENNVVKAIALAIAGILLLLPGILSDIVAVLILLPAIQNKFKNFAKDYATKNPEKLMQMMASKMGGMGGFDPSKMGGMGGQNPFGGANPFGNQNPFGNNNPFGANNPFGGFGNTGKGTTVDGTAKTVKDAKKITHSANDN